MEAAHIDHGVLYILTGEARLLPQLERSLRSLRSWGRYTGPIKVVTDLPVESLRRRYDLEVVQVQPLPGAMSSRRWKTEIGAFSRHALNLFLDTDTLILNPVSVLFDYLQSSRADVLLVEDVLNGQEAVKQTDLYAPEELERSQKLGVPDRPYFNSGVIAWRATPESDRLFSMWSEEWSLYEGRDQLSLARALIRAAPTLGRLTRAMHNFYNPFHEPEPVIVYHYFCLKLEGDLEQQARRFVVKWSMARILGRRNVSAMLKVLSVIRKKLKR